MIIDVPFIHRLGIVPEGKQKARPTRILDTVPVLIPEFSGEEVDVVAEWSVKLWDSENYLRRSYIGCGDGFYSQIISGDRDPAATFVGLEVWKESIASRGYTTLPDLWVGQFENYQKDLYEAIDDLAFKNFATGEILRAKKVEPGDRDEETAKISVRAQDFIAVDGIVFRRSLEPLLVESNRRDYASFSIKSGGDDGIVSKWRLDRMEDLLNQKPWRGEKAIEATDEFQLEVYRPDLLFYDRERAHLDWKINNLITGWDRYLKDASKATLLAYGEARDAFNALDPGSDTGVEEAIEAALALIASTGEAKAGSNDSEVLRWATAWREDPRRGSEIADIEFDPSITP